MFTFTDPLLKELAIDHLLLGCTLKGVRIDPDFALPSGGELERDKKVQATVANIKESAKEDGRIHPLFGRHKTTNRITVSRPNLLAIKEDVKRMILPDRGHVMMECYFKHAELRCAQVVSGDTDFFAMLNTLDPHEFMGAKLGIPRNAAKTAAFAALSNKPHVGWIAENPVEGGWYATWPKRYLEHFPVLRDWLAANRFNHNASTQIQTMGSAALDEMLYKVAVELDGTGARIVMPSIDGLMVSVPEGREEYLREQIRFAMSQNCLNAYVEINTSTTLYMP